MSDVSVGRQAPADGTQPLESDKSLGELVSRLTGDSGQTAGLASATAASGGGAASGGRPASGENPSRPSPQPTSRQTVTVRAIDSGTDCTSVL